MGKTRYLADYTKVPTYRNTEFMDWWQMLNRECAKLGLGERPFGEAHDAYEMGESPDTAAAHFAATA